MKVLNLTGRPARGEVVHPPGGQKFLALHYQRPHNRDEAWRYAIRLADMVDDLAHFGLEFDAVGINPPAFQALPLELALESRGFRVAYWTPEGWVVLSYGGCSDYEETGEMPKVETPKEEECSAST